MLGGLSGALLALSYIAATSQTMLHRHAIPLAIILASLGLLGGYTALTATTMHYTVENKGIKVKSGILREKISYKWIEKAETINIEKIRHSIPSSIIGLLYGTYIIRELGTVTIYGTRLKDKAVMLTLTDSTKILLTPKDPENMVKAVSRPISRTPKSYPRINVNINLLTLLTLTLPITLFWTAAVLGSLLLTGPMSFANTIKALLSMRADPGLIWLVKSLAPLSGWTFLTRSIALKYAYRNKFIVSIAAATSYTALALAITYLFRLW